VRLGILFVLLFGPLTALFGWLLTTRTIPIYRASRRGTVAQGRVLRIKVREGNASSNSYPLRVRLADIEFTTADGTRVTYREGLETGVECDAHDSVTVHYDPASPRTSATIKDPDDTSRNLLVISGVALMFGLALLWGVLLILGVVSDSSGSVDPTAG
jgi:hypothetical protein